MNEKAFRAMMDPSVERVKAEKGGLFVFYTAPGSEEAITVGGGLDDNDVLNLLGMVAQKSGLAFPVIAKGIADYLNAEAKDEADQAKRHAEGEVAG